MSDWKARHTPATEPARGWPARPWDHRFVIDGEDSAVRIAVDLSGEPILDADGDEVQSGPGFDHEEAKVTRGNFGPPRAAQPVPTGRLDPEVVDALARAREMSSAFGHCWVGTEHVGLALVERSPLAVEIVGAPWDVLARAVAWFYEGSYAAARYSLVVDRLAGPWQPVAVRDEMNPEFNEAVHELVYRVVVTSEAAGQAQSSVEDVARMLMTPFPPGGLALVPYLLNQLRDRDAP